MGNAPSLPAVPVTGEGLDISVSAKGAVAGACTARLVTARGAARVAVALGAVLAGRSSRTCSIALGATVSVIVRAIGGGAATGSVAVTGGGAAGSTICAMLAEPVKAANTKAARAGVEKYLDFNMIYLLGYRHHANSAWGDKGSAVADTPCRIPVEAKRLIWRSAKSRSKSDKAPRLRCCYLVAEQALIASASGRLPVASNRAK